MNRRTPRRRISPRTVRRYRAIKNFVRRALGSSSQPDIKTNSSISVSVLDLRQKIDGIEQQLNTVSRHCHDLATLESRLKLTDSIDSENNSIINTKKIKEAKRELPYEISHDQSNKPVNNKSVLKGILPDDEALTKATALSKMVDENHLSHFKENKKNNLYHRLDPIEEHEQTLSRRRNRTTLTNIPTDLPMHSSHSLTEPRIYTRYLDAGYSEVHRQRNRKKTECFNTNDGFFNFNNHKEKTCGDHKNHRNKYVPPDLNQDFIADIIRRQYRPVKMFGRRDSDFSQFSAPVCRDQELTVREPLQEGSDLCSCCHIERGGHVHSRYMCRNDLSDMRSLCDTRLYSSRKHKQNTNHRKHTNDFYNDAAMYDVIPVKEKSSPKSRRKFVQDNTLMEDNYREVPPSPRTQRPRLNLQAQHHTEDDEYGEIPLEKQLKQIKRLKRKSLLQNEGSVSNMSSEVFIHNRNFKCMQNSEIPNNPKSYIEECVGTMSQLQCPTLTHGQSIVNNDTTLNTQTDISGEKTDKALNEIKDILQSFLQEIKKESSQHEKLSNTPQSEVLTNINEMQQQIKGNSFNSNNFGHCGMPPFIQSFPNSCCYSILPVCPLNCMQNGFVLSSPSFTCAACANNSKGACESISKVSKRNIKDKTNCSKDASNETQKLIKEIHNLILLNPKSNPKKQSCKDATLAAINKNEEIKTHASRSVGGSSKVSKQDAKVGTRKLQCYSKSCEAIGSREAMSTRYVTNASYSDTVLEKGSGEEMTTESTSESEYSTETTVTNKKKGNKFKKILQSIGMLKRNKTDVIEELTESDININIPKASQRSPFQSHQPSPFQQHIINYNMHAQEYFNPPGVPCHEHQYECCSHLPKYNPRTCYSPTNVDNKINKSRGKYFQEHDALPQCSSPHHNTVPMHANYFDPYYTNIPPQVPVCLKEIEVKSIGTQSVRKISLLQKLTNKMQVPVQQMNESASKQSSIKTSKDQNPRNNPQSTLFDWKKIHEKAMQRTTDPLKFSYKTQKRLAEGDNTMRNAMLKKLFYKRNPFSPRNLLVRTLLGKDKSSFGEPPKMYKPRMFL